jgi:hypothetical protein
MKILTLLVFYPHMHACYNKQSIRTYVLYVHIIMRKGSYNSHLLDGMCLDIF